MLKWNHVCTWNKGSIVACWTDVNVFMKDEWTGRDTRLIFTVFEAENNATGERRWRENGVVVVSLIRYLGPDLFGNSPFCHFQLGPRHQNMKWDSSRVSIWGWIWLSFRLVSIGIKIITQHNPLVYAWNLCFMGRFVCFPRFFLLANASLGRRNFMFFYSKDHLRGCNWRL